MKKTLLYCTSVFLYACGLEIADKFQYFKDNGDSIYKYQLQNWDPSEALPNTPINNLIEKNQGHVEDFNGTPLTAVAVVIYETHTPQYSFKNVSGIEVFDKGWMVDLLQDLSLMLNFSIIAVKSPKYTQEFDNGTLTGPGGMILAGQADLMIGLQYVSENQLLPLRAIHPLGIYRISAFVKQPKLGGARNIYTQPFETMAWLVIFVILAGLVLSTLICCATEKKYFKEEYHLEDTVAWIWGIFLSQSFYDPGTLPTRLIFVSALSLALVLSNSYSAFLISSLATEFNPITTYKDLAKYKYTVIADERNNYTCQEIYLSDASRKKYCGFYQNEIDSVMKLYRNRRGRYAFVKSLDLIAVTAKELGYPDEEICSATDLVLPFKKPVTSMYGLKKSPLINILNPKLLRIHETGVNIRYMKVFARQTNVICSKTKFTYDPDVEVADVYIAFCALLFGVVVSCLLCICERWLRKMARRKGNMIEILENDNAGAFKSEYEINYINWATKSQYSTYYQKRN